MIEFTDIIVFKLSDQPDADGEIISPTSLLTFPPTVPVTDYFMHDKVIGKADLKRHGDAVVANITISKTTVRPVMAARRHGKPLYPCIAGRIKKREGVVIKELAIESIGLCPGANTDPSIGPLVFVS